MYLNSGDKKFPSEEDTDSRRVSRIPSDNGYTIRTKVSTPKSCSKPINSSESFANGPYRFKLYESKS